MKILYNENYNIELGLLRYLHPFDGTKLKKIHERLKGKRGISFVSPAAPVSMEAIDENLSSIMRHRVRMRNGIFQALEIPRIPFIGFSYLDKKVLSPMRWGVAGTLLGAVEALESGETHWNLAGGYHHASPQNMEGFCIYNDISICHQQLLKGGLLAQTDKILIVDTDAHHGNGNAYAFMENDRATILDIFNASIYPQSSYTRNRVDIPVSLPSGTKGDVYLEKCSEALERVGGDFRIAFVIAGTDVLKSDKLGGLDLNVEDVARRDQLTLDALKKRKVPTVVLGGGGYGRESAESVISSIIRCTRSN